MHVKFILPALTEATSPFFRPIKYSLFPPLGLATLAGYLSPDVSASIVDEHVERLSLEDSPDLVVIQVYITNAYRAYRIADHYRSRGVRVALGGLHATALPDEAACHADHVFVGPGEDTFPRFLSDLRDRCPQPRYVSRRRSLVGAPAIRRDLIDRTRYLVPNSLVVSRGCPHHCDFCYKDAFFEGGRSFYTMRVDEALREIESLPGRHLYFLDDHLLGNPHFARSLFAGMRGMRRLFQGAATVDSILRGDLIERAYDAGLRSLFVGFESLSETSLAASNKRQNLGRDYGRVIARLRELGIMINGSFVFGLDGDDEGVFERTVDFAVAHGLTTATFHVMTPYPGTALYERLRAADRIRSYDWDLYDTRHVVYKPLGMSAQRLKAGYDWSYREFYRWGRLARAARANDRLELGIKQFLYSVGWKKFEPLWDLAVRSRLLGRARPLLEQILSRTRGSEHGTFGGSMSVAQGVERRLPLLETSQSSSVRGAA